MKSKKKLFIAEWKTDANYVPAIHTQENIRADSIEEARAAADILWETHSGRGNVLEHRIWEIGNLVYEKE